MASVFIVTLTELLHVDIDFAPQEASQAEELVEDLLNHLVVADASRFKLVLSDSADHLT